MSKSHKITDKQFVRLDCTIPVELKNKLISLANELGLNVKSTLITILNEKLNN